MEMTKTQLADFLKETTLPAVLEHVTKEVGARVEDAINKRVEELRKPTGASPIPAEPAKAVTIDREKGHAFARVVRAMATAKQMGGGPVQALELLKGWGDVDLADSIQKVMSAGNAVSGGYLVPPQYSNEVIELLRAKTVVRRAGVPTVGMSTGTFSIPKITDGSTASYIGENVNITPSELKTGNVTLTFKKLAALVPVSNDLLRYANPSADTIIRNDVVRALALREDQAFLRDNGLAATPKGLRYWVNPSNLLSVTAGGVTLANVTLDLGRVMLALEEANIGMTRFVWIFSPRSKHYLMTVQNTTGAFVYRDEMLRGTLWGFPFYVTTTIPKNLTDLGGTDESEVYGVDLDEMILGESQSLIVDSSAEAAYFDGTNVVSAYSKDQTVVRAIAEHDFAARRDTAIAILRGVRWGA